MTYFILLKKELALVFNYNRRHQITILTKFSSVVVLQNMDSLTWLIEIVLWDGDECRYLCEKWYI